MFNNANVLFRTRFEDGMSCVERVVNTRSWGASCSSCSSPRTRLSPAYVQLLMDAPYLHKDIEGMLGEPIWVMLLDWSTWSGSWLRLLCLFDRSVLTQIDYLCLVWNMPTEWKQVNDKKAEHSDFQKCLRSLPQLVQNHEGTFCNSITSPVPLILSPIILWRHLPTSFSFRAFWCGATNYLVAVCPCAQTPPPSRSLTCSLTPAVSLAPLARWRLRCSSNGPNFLFRWKWRRISTK